MTDNTQPEAGSAHIIRLALELGLLWIDGSGRDKVREALDALDTLEAQLEAIGAGGVSGPLIGRASLQSPGFTAADMATASAQGFRDGVASLSANAGEPTQGAFQRALSIRTAQGWTLRGDKVPVLYTDEINGEQVCRDDVWLCTTAAFAAPPTAQAEGWRSMETAPRDGTEVLANTAGLGRVVVYWDDEESQWGTGLGYLDRDAPTHWMPLPPPPTSAEGVEHG